MSKVDVLSIAEAKAFRLDSGTSDNAVSGRVVKMELTSSGQLVRVDSMVSVSGEVKE